MAGYQFDELTKDLAGAKSRRGFLKALGAGFAAVAAATTIGSIGSGRALAISCTGSQGTFSCTGHSQCCGDICCDTRTQRCNKPNHCVPSH